MGGACRALPGWTGEGARPHTIFGGGAYLLAVVFCSYFLSLPVHAGGLLVIDLHAIHAHVAFAGFGIASDYAGKRDKASGVFWPTLKNGKFIEREMVAANDFLAWSRRDGFRKEFSHFRKHG